jgi:hypothetical protein
MDEKSSDASPWPALIVVGALFLFFVGGGWIKHELLGYSRTPTMQSPLLACNNLPTNREKMDCFARICAFDDPNHNAPHCR